MRTTVNIDDDLYRQLKETAARSGRTMAAVLEDVVRRGLYARERRNETTYRVQPQGRGGLRPGVDVSSNTALAEAMAEGVAVNELQ